MSIIEWERYSLIGLSIFILKFSGKCDVYTWFKLTISFEDFLLISLELYSNIFNVFSFNDLIVDSLNWLRWLRNSSFLLKSCLINHVMTSKFRIFQNNEIFFSFNVTIDLINIKRKNCPHFSHWNKFFAQNFVYKLCIIQSSTNKCFIIIDKRIFKKKS